MVKLDRIYTGGGDKGQTSLVDGSRAPKDAPRLCAIGDVDEANAVIGLARAELEEAKQAELVDILARVQNDLCDLGADLATPGDKPDGGSLRIQQIQVTRLEGEIDAQNEKLEPLTSFILPGGSKGAIWLHLARTIVRRAERTMVRLNQAEGLNPLALTYINRLSDLMFVLSRQANDGGRKDALWTPGENARSES